MEDTASMWLTQAHPISMIDRMKGSCWDLGWKSHHIVLPVHCYLTHAHSTMLWIHLHRNTNVVHIPCSVGLGRPLPQAVSR